jgi:non-specific protein-tyrosine kinase
MANEFGLITIDQPLSAASEAYRTLRLNLQFASLDKPLHTLLVSSAGPDEGKTTALVNLAVTMAHAEQRVIVVDCDLRRPQVHLFFGLDNTQGLTNALLDERSIEQPALQATAVDNLRILASGPLPPRPADLLGSQRMIALIANLTAQADVVLFDAPPIMTATDAAILATRLDGVLLVVSAGQTRREDATLSVERLQKVNAHLVGTVLNNAELSAPSAVYR